MSDKDFLVWWDKEGSGMPPMQGEDAETHVRRICEIAWANGEYKSSARQWQPKKVYVVEVEMDSIKGLYETYCVCATEEHAKAVSSRLPNSIYLPWDIESLPTPPKEK